MKIVVFSDSHGYLENMIDVIARMETQVNAIFHLGDCVKDAEELGKKFPDIPIYVVRGNNDFGVHTPSFKIVRVGKVCFLLTHGHKERVHTGLDYMGYWAEENGANMALFGHTHRGFNEYFGRIRLFNPGSISLPRDSGTPTFGILTVEDGVVEGEIMEYFGRGNWHSRHRK